MSDNTKRPAAEGTSAAPPSTPVPLSASHVSKSDAQRQAQPSNQAHGVVPAEPALEEDPTAELKQRLEETRLPASLKEQILADLPPPEERERMYRELQERGGRLSFEQFVAALGLDARSKS